MDYKNNQEVTELEEVVLFGAAPLFSEFAADLPAGLTSASLEAQGVSSASVGAQSVLVPIPGTPVDGGTCTDLNGNQIPCVRVTADKDGAGGKTRTSGK